MKSLSRIWIFIVLLPAVSLFPREGFARSAREIDASVETALELFRSEVYGGQELLAQAKGVLVFPRVIRGGIVLGAEYGVGSLLIGGKAVDYYNTIAGSFGFQFGGQMKNIYYLFMDDSVLKEFQRSEGWKFGVDGSVALITVGFAGSVDTFKTDQPIAAYVLNQKGLMYNMTLEGAKVNKINAA